MSEKEINKMGQNDKILLKNANGQEKEIPLINKYEKKLFVTSIPLTIIFIIILAIIIAIFCIHKYNKKKLKEKEEEFDIYSKYKKLEKLEENNMEIVYKAKNLLTEELVAIKEIPLKKIQNNSREAIENEIKFMNIFNNSNNSVNIYEKYEQKNTTFIVMEICDGSLSTYLEKSENGFSIYEIKVIFNQLNNILYELRSKNMVHNNINLENIFIKFKGNGEEGFDVKLSNYSLAKLISKKKYLFYNKWGIKPYDNKENINYVEKYDLLVLGINIYRMIFKKKAESYREYYENIYYYVKDKDLRNLLKGLIIEDVNKRIGWNDYFKHPFFIIDNIDFGQIKNIKK